MPKTALEEAKWMPYLRQEGTDLLVWLNVHALKDPEVKKIPQAERLDRLWDAVYKGEKNPYSNHIRWSATRPETATAAKTKAARSGGFYQKKG